MIDNTNTEFTELYTCTCCGRAYRRPIEFAQEPHKLCLPCGLEHIRMDKERANGSVVTPCTHFDHARQKSTDARPAPAKPVPPEPGSINPFDVDHLVWIGGHWLGALGWRYEQGVGWRKPNGELCGGPGDHGHALTEALSDMAIRELTESVTDSIEKLAGQVTAKKARALLGLPPISLPKRLDVKHYQKGRSTGITVNVSKVEVTIDEDFNGNVLVRVDDADTGETLDEKAWGSGK